ncbi:hypothetical protein Zmor_015684 [Zophobas morio]|uniref:Odorant receptor n=2 Tax=Zophobas morio TaxID=2755281 RepID=A0AA38IEY0_9CUCU|nr:hypothetical protein Zmor_015684 [Zophobas morio]
MIEVYGDIEKMTETSFLLLTNSNQALKIYVFLFNGSRVWTFIENLNKNEFKPQNSVQRNSLSEEIKISKATSKIFLFMCFVTCCLWGIFPFLDRQPGEKIRLPLSGWYPFGTDTSPSFELVYAYQIFATWINGMGNITMDTFISGAIMAISVQLKILNNSFEVMTVQNYQSRNLRCESTLKNLRRALVKNIVHYKSILQLSAEMTSLFTICMTSQFAVSVIIICMTMFQMSLVSVASLQFLSMLLYQACILLEIFLWCYYGNEVIIESEKLTQSAYVCEWIECTKEFKKDLLFFMTRTQFPLKLYAGGYFTLSLGTYMAILKSSWSYFAVLNSMHTEEV